MAKGGPKRAHTKSRLGCSNCKQRRIRCDQNAPQCGYCTKKGLECPLQQWQPAMNRFMVLTPGSTCFQVSQSTQLASITGTMTDRQSSTDANEPLNQLQMLTASPGLLIPRGREYCIDDLMLMHHYCTKLFASMGTIHGGTAQRLFQTEIPRIARDHRFFMHSLLALSAANLAMHSDDVREAYFAKANDHHTKAVYLFRCSVSEVKPDAAIAVFLFCIFTMLTTFGLDSMDLASLEDPIAKFLANISAFRLSSIAVDPVRDHIQDSEIVRALTRLQRQRHEVEGSSAESLNHFDKLIERNVTLESEKNIYRDAAGHMRDLYSAVTGEPADWGFIVAWGMTAKQDFYERLQQRSLPALVLLAHWCVAAINAPKRWFMPDFPVRIIEAVWLRVRGTSWQEGLRWPLERIRSDH